VSPARNIVWVTAADGIHQITQHRDSFPKPTESYEVLNVYGTNILSTEGAEWKKHRKVISPSLNEKNNAMVFKEAIFQTQAMVRRWAGPNGKGNTTLKDIPKDSMRVALHIISRVGFGVGLSWPGEERPHDGSKVNYGSHEIQSGFTMSFEDSLSTLLDGLIWILLIPRWLLRYVPIKHAQKALDAYINWGQYMKAIHDQKVEEARNGEHTEGMDMMGALVRSSLPSSSKPRSGSAAEKADTGKMTLTEAEKLGDAFVLIIAGHETTANSIHFSLMFLAMHPSSQRHLQKDIDSIFGSSEPEEWDYDDKINACLGGMLGAVLNEELRLMPPVINIPKSVSKDQDRPIVLDGKKYVLPAGAFVNLNATGVHRNPRYWPSRGPGVFSGKDNDIDDFVPERWLKGKDKDGAGASGNGKGESAEGTDESEAEGDVDLGFTGRDTAPQLFHPTRGSFVPFSDGARSCLGRRLAQVEFIAVLAVIFQKYSMELDVGEWASDEEVDRMVEKERREVYRKAQEKAYRVLRSASTIITLKLHEGEGYIPARLVRRGEERFIHLMD
jgi:cytochrome P450